MNIKSIASFRGVKIINFFHKLYTSFSVMKLPNRDMILPYRGLQILVRNPRQSKIGRSIYTKGLWEPEATRFISPKIKPGMTVLDIGADIGYYTLVFAKLVGSKGWVFSFEPIPKAKWYLDKNVEINGLKNVKTFGFALFDKTGVVCLEDPFNKSTINISKETLSENDIQVETKVFDEWRSKEVIDHIDLVKIDAEGAELNILRGMKSTLQSDRPLILVEVHPQQLETFGFSPFALTEFLSEFGYQLESVDKQKIDFSQGNITLFCK